MPTLPKQDVLRKVRKLRNVVAEMIAELEAVKPAPLPQRELQRVPAIEIAYTKRPDRLSAIG